PRIAGPEVHQVRFSVVGATVPDRRAAGLPRVARPRFVAGFARARNRIEAPGLLAVLGIEGGDEPANAAVAARHADDDLVLEDQRRVRNRELVHGARRLGVPEDLAGPGVDG